MISYLSTQKPGKTDLKNLSPKITESAKQNLEIHNNQIPIQNRIDELEKLEVESHNAETAKTSKMKTWKKEIKTT